MGQVWHDWSKFLEIMNTEWGIFVLPDCDQVEPEFAVLGDYRLPRNALVPIRLISLEYFTAMQDHLMSIPFEENFDHLVDWNESKPEDSNNLPAALQVLLNSPSYSLAFSDRDFLMSDTSRSIRIELEMNKAEWYQRKFGIRSTVIVFGSARFVSRHQATRLMADAENQAGFAAE